MNNAFDPSVAEIVYSEDSTCSGCAASMEENEYALVFTAWVKGVQEHLIFCEDCIDEFASVLEELYNEDEPPVPAIEN